MLPGPKPMGAVEPCFLPDPTVCVCTSACQAPKLACPSPLLAVTLDLNLLKASVLTFGLGSSSGGHGSPPGYPPALCMLSVPSFLTWKGEGVGGDTCVPAHL